VVRVTGVRSLLGAGTYLLGHHACDAEDLAGLVRRPRLDPYEVTGPFGGVLVVDVGEVGGDEASVVRFALGGEILPAGDAVTAARRAALGGCFL
jgi:hypothetical protein